MTLTRRSFFRTAAAAGLVARNAAEMVQQQGLARLGASSVVGIEAASQPVEVPHVGISPSRDTLFGRALSAFFRKQGIPTWKKDQLQRTARESRLLDPDLAALRSISPSAMLRIQWRRNEKNILNLYLRRIEEEEERHEYQNKHRTDWL